MRLYRLMKDSASNTIKYLKRNEKVFYQNIKKYISRNVSLIIALILTSFFIILTLDIMLSSSIFTLKAMQVYCSTSSSDNNNNSKSGSKANLINNTNNNSTQTSTATSSSSSSSQSTSNCSTITIGKINFNFTKAEINLAYFYSRYSSYFNPLSNSHSLAAITAEEENQENKSLSAHWPYTTKEVLSSAPSEKYILLYYYKRCMVQKLDSGVKMERTNQGCDLYVLGVMANFSIYLLFIFYVFSFVGLYLYSRSLFLRSKMYKLLVSFNLVCTFLLFFCSFIFFKFGSGLDFTAGTFSVIFNSSPVAINKDFWFGVRVDKFFLGCSVVQFLSYLVVKSVFIELKVEKSKYKVDYNEMMNASIFEESSEGLKNE